LCTFTYLACTSSTGFVLGIVTGLITGARAAAEGGDGDIEDGEGAGAGCEGNAGAFGEDDKDDNGPGGANKEDDTGEASGADSAKTPGAKKAAAVSSLRLPPCPARSDGLRVPDARWHRSGCVVY
jgi:hypothetical protein